MQSTSLSQLLDSDRCRTSDCDAPPVDALPIDGPHRHCYAHSDHDVRGPLLDQVRHGGPLDFVRGNRIDNAMLEEILDAARNDEGRAQLRDADFSRCTFSDDVVLTHIDFLGTTRFDRAAFGETLHIDQATFHGRSFWMRMSTGSMVVDHARFHGPAYFNRMRAHHYLRMSHTRFERRVTFASSTSAPDLHAAPTGDASFQNVSLQAGVSLRGSRLRDLTITAPVLQGDLHLGGAKLSGSVRITFTDHGNTARLRLADSTIGGNLVVRNEDPYANTLHVDARDIDVEGDVRFDHGSFEGTVDFGTSDRIDHLGFLNRRLPAPGTAPVEWHRPARIGGTFAIEHAQLDDVSVQGLRAAEISIKDSRITTLIASPLVIGPDHHPTLVERLRIDQLHTRDLSLRALRAAGSLEIIGLTTIDGKVDLAELSPARDNTTIDEVEIIGDLTITRSTFTSHIDLAVGHGHVLATATRFEGGGRLVATGGTITADAAAFNAPFTITRPAGDGGLPFVRSTEGRGVDDLLRIASLKGAELDDALGLPRILSLEGADVSELRLGDIDLGACSFQGALNLRKLDLPSTRSLRKTSRAFRARRHMLHDEVVWREHRRAERREMREKRLWAKPDHRWNPVRRWRKGRTGPSQQFPVGAPELARNYRALRQSLEERRDEPGAADLYYGEMEMRRLDPRAPRAERAILGLYWLTCGYGLRPWRAAACFLASVAVCALLLLNFGLPRPGAYPATTQPSYRCTTSAHHCQLKVATRVAAGSAFFRQQTDNVHGWGNEISGAERIVGPIFLGLTALSIRGRVKRS